MKTANQADTSTPLIATTIKELAAMAMLLGRTILRLLKRLSRIRMSATPYPQAPLKGHEVSLYHPGNGSFLGGTQGDLWPVVVGPSCYIVDNNVPWERIARAEPSTHFVLGRTMVLESDSLRGAVRRLEREPLPNVFTLEIVDVGGGKSSPSIDLDRRFD